VPQDAIDAPARLGMRHTCLVIQTSLHPFDSDHVSFLDQGFPAVLTIEPRAGWSGSAAAGAGRAARSRNAHDRRSCGHQLRHAHSRLFLGRQQLPHHRPEEHRRTEDPEMAHVRDSDVHRP
jgi:hypothetical protein